MNLDAMCARCGYEIVLQASQSKKDSQGRIPKRDKAKIENTITKSLGVLQEDGVYAFFLFLSSRKGDLEDTEEVTAGELDSQVKKLLRHNDLQLLGQSQEGDFKAVSELTENLDRLLLARQLIERSLIYARYHAKALETVNV